MSATAPNAPRRSSPPDARVRVCVPCGSLGDNGFGSEDAIHFAEALKQNTSLTKLQ